MKHIIVGTAGHIDHGKTSLIKVLTGTNTDRLKEEQRRGITIDIGFAYIDLPSGTRAGIVDVPGHERFIRNMLAGISGVDVVILVVAADEGIMPQTREHLDILSLLDVKNGIVALTKTDMVDEAWIELVTEEVRGALAGTFLKDAPIVPFSAVTGAGKDEVINMLDRAAVESNEKKSDMLPRLPVDRAFVLSGIGTVITGTLVEGTVRVGDSVEVYPKGILAKVRSIESHGNKCEEVGAGQRTAINLTGVKKEDIGRGDVIALPGTMHTTNIVDCRLKFLRGVERTFSNRARIRFHHGTNEVIGRMVLLNDEKVSGGDEVFVQILLEREIAVRTGDRYILRSYSPVTTIGGGVVVDAGPARHKRFREEVIDGLARIESGEAERLVEQAVFGHSGDFYALSRLVLPIGLSLKDALEIAAKLEDEGAVLPVSDDKDRVYIHRDFYERLADTALALLSAHHEKHPLEAGMSKEELRVRLVQKLKVGRDINEIRSYIKAIEDRLLAESVIYEAGGGSAFAARGFSVKVNNTQQQLVERLMNEFAVPATPFEVLKGFEKSEKADTVFKMLVSAGKLIKLNPETAQDAEKLAAMVQKLKDAAAASTEKSIALGAARDLLGVSRKQALSILEYLDKSKVTKKVGDARIFIK